MSLKNNDSGSINEKSSISKVEQSVPCEDLVERFQKKAMDLARQGILGAMRTRVASLQNSWSNLVSFLDDSSVPIMIYGEKGTGKRNLVEEFLLLDNFARRLSGKGPVKLKVYRGDYAVPGFTQQLLPSSHNNESFIYLEHVDRLNASLQEELLRHFEIRKKLSEKGIELPRLVISTERALSLQVIQSRFSKPLFQALTQFAIFLPSLNERQEDLPYLISAISKSVTGTIQVPSTEVLNRFSSYMWPENIDELRKTLESMLAKNPRMNEWSLMDLPSSLRPFQSTTFEKLDAKSLAEHYSERNKIKSVLKNSEGNRGQAAQKMGVSRQELLEKMLRYGVR